MRRDFDSPATGLEPLYRNDRLMRLRLHTTAYTRADPSRFAQELFQGDGLPGQAGMTSDPHSRQTNRISPAACRGALGWSSPSPSSLRQRIGAGETAELMPLRPSMERMETWVATWSCGEVNAQTRFLFGLKRRFLVHLIAGAPVFRSRRGRTQ